MTKVEFKKASRPLSEYATKARKGPVIVYKAGKTVRGRYSDPERG
jgi:hypothetical protein